jgi:ubiquinone/menaquinone biosynthesis C-methylase UbiE
MNMDTGQTHDAEYVLGHSAQEFERLINQAQLYEPFTRQFFHDAGVEAGMRVLDVGSGSGDVSFLTARLVGPPGQVVGIDRSPVAVATATRRAQELGLPNTRFMLGEADEMTFAEPFDAVVGRFVLMFNPYPVVALQNLASLVRPGGVIAFQEPDFSGCRSLPVQSAFSQCVRWIIQAVEPTSDPFFGLKLSTIFTAAGLPQPTLLLQAGIGAGPDHPLYALVAETVRTLLPTLESLGIATANEVQIDTLARRISDEAVATSGTVVFKSLIGAAARKPTD